MWKVLAGIGALLVAYLVLFGLLWVCVRVIRHAWKGPLCVALLLCAGAARAEAPNTARVASTVLFVAAQASLALDAMQTWGIAGSQCPRGPGSCGSARTELNPLLGEHPSDGVVLAYFGGLALVQTALYVWGPSWLSSATSGVTLAIEVPQIAHNFHVGASLALPF